MSTRQTGASVIATGWTNVKNSSGTNIYHSTTVRWESGGRVLATGAKRWGTGSVSADATLSLAIWNSNWGSAPYVYWGS